MQMPADTTLIIPFTIGLLSASHCLGMCGSIVGALSLSLPASVRSRPASLISYVLAYNLGRLLSYATAGAVVAWTGNTLFNVLIPPYGHRLLQSLATLLLVAIGLYLAGWFPAFSSAEKVGARLWAHLDPIARRLLPARSPVTAFAFGIIWGWLPCGLVYSVLAVAAASGDARDGTLVMLSFGLGTLPALTGGGVFAASLTRLLRRPRMRQATGVFIVIMALAGLWYGGLAPEVVHHGHL